MNETITLGGGCFWCLEAVYELADGVVAVESGYSNGHVKNPSYQQVCGGDTGHAEVVKVTFDPQRITLREVLEIFFTIHDPTTLNRQGNDVGSQYRSGIYFETPEQERVAREVLAEVNARERRPRGHRGGAAGELLSRRGLPPALLRQQSGAGLLRLRRRAEGREIPQDLRQAREASLIRTPVSMLPSSARARCRAIAFALLAFVLVGAQSLGLAHRVLHGGAASSMVGVVDPFGHAPHDGVACPLYDQLAGAELLTVDTPPAPVAAATFIEPAAIRLASHAGAAPSPFRARAPPISAA